MNEFWGNKMKSGVGLIWNKKRINFGIVKNNVHPNELILLQTHDENKN
jgi:hypothetical protein